MRKQSETVRFTRAIFFAPLSPQKITLLQSVHAHVSQLCQFYCVGCISRIHSSQGLREAASRKKLLHLPECRCNVVCPHAERNHLVRVVT